MSYPPDPFREAAHAMRTALVSTLGMILIVVVLGLAGGLAGCAGAFENVDLSNAVELEGDLRCEGEGELRILGAVALQASGGVGVSGSVDGGGNTEGTHCEGVTFGLGPWQFAFGSGEQDDPLCADVAGERRVEGPVLDVEKPPGGD